MKIMTKDILKMKIGDNISKSDLKNVITKSKVPMSEYWQGDDYIINDTYQKGINWIGNIKNPLAVIIKSKLGKYDEDSHNGELHYAFQTIKNKKTKESTIDKSSKANIALINSMYLKYPLLYFIDVGGYWQFLGKFIVNKINAKDVILQSFYDETNYESNITYTEGNIKIIQHSIYERNLSLIRKIKEEREWKCDICNIDLKKYYGIAFIEAHHKRLISEYKNDHNIIEDDIVLLCPNCHTATHYMMKKYSEYDEIKEILKNEIGKNKYMV
jgi:putative restriction endonuclease